MGKLLGQLVLFLQLHLRQFTGTCSFLPTMVSKATPCQHTRPGVLARTQEHDCAGMPRRVLLILQRNRAMLGLIVDLWVDAGLELAKVVVVGAHRELTSLVAVLKLQPWALDWWIILEE